MVSGKRRLQVSTYRGLAGINESATQWNRAAGLAEFDLPVCANAPDLVETEVQAQLVDVLREVGEEYEVDFSNTCFALDPNVVSLRGAH